MTSRVYFYPSVFRSGMLIDKKIEEYEKLELVGNKLNPSGVISLNCLSNKDESNHEFQVTIL